MRRIVKTLALLAAAVVYVPLVIDWCAPGHGFHQAAVALGGYGPAALRPFADFFLWDRLVRLIGWDLQGLGTVSMFGALVTLGLVAYCANRIAHGALPLSTGLVCAAFVATPGLLRAATRPDSLMVLLPVPLLGLALLMRLLAKSGSGKGIERFRRHPLPAVCALLLLAYGFFGFACLGPADLLEDSLHLAWFAVLGVLPHLVFAKRMRQDALPAGFRIRFLGIWIAAIAISAVVAAKSFGIGRASGRLAERLIANAGGDLSLAADPALADICLWTASADRRDEIVGWISGHARRSEPDPERYFPTVDLWHECWADFVAMDRREPFRDHYRGLFRTCGNRLGKRLLDAGDLKGAWTVFWEVLDGVDEGDGVAIMNLCLLIGRGYEADPASREQLRRRFLRHVRGLKMPDRLTEENAKIAKTVQQTIQTCVSNRLVRADQIGQRLLDLDRLLEDWDSAERDARGILALDRRNVPALVVMAEVHGRRGDHPESERCLRRAMETGRAGVAVTNDLVFALVRMGHAKDAVPLARSVVRADPDNWNFRETLAFALIRSGELEDGAGELRAAANLARRAKVPARAQVRLAFDRAWLFKNKGDDENLRNTLQILRNLKGLERGLLLEIAELQK